MATGDDWTVEDEDERFGAFGAAVYRARGLKRLVGLFLVLLLLTPFVIAVVSVLRAVF